jgi:hypothetical protein
LTTWAPKVCSFTHSSKKTILRYSHEETILLTLEKSIFTFIFVEDAFILNLGRACI